MNWIEIGDAEDVPHTGQSYLFFDGCDFDVDYVDVDVDTGVHFFANGSGYTHYMELSVPMVNEDD